jgi:HAT1-interacting factor 1
MTSSPTPQDNPPIAGAVGQQPSSTGDLESKLSELVAKATLQYSHRNYNAATDIYAQAAELQAEIYGEDSPRNADLLYHYGRSLYQVGVSKSDVLGGKVAGDGGAEGGKAKEAGSNTANSSKVEEEVVSKVAGKVAEEKGGAAKADSVIPNKPFFQITGDENFDDSDDEEGEEGAAEGAAGAEEEDDLKAAWDILDLSRVLFVRQWGEFSDEGKGKGTEESDDIKRVKERLSDVHDLLAEISLESENFPSAVSDFRAALELKEELYPIDSSVLAEAHYKLSLALEFASTTANGELQDGEEPKVDEAGREEAAKEMEAAIESCRLRVQREEAELAAGRAEGGEGESVKKRTVTRKSIDDVKEMIAEMEQRVSAFQVPT